jgi:hypothetical protein
MADQEQLDDFIRAPDGLGTSTENLTLQTGLGWIEVGYEGASEKLMARPIVARGRVSGSTDAMVGAEAQVPAATAFPFRAKAKASNNSAGPIGFEAQRWKAADALRNNTDAVEYKHVVLGLQFLKYIYNAFEAKHSALVFACKKAADLEDPDECRCLSEMNLPLRGIEVDFGAEHADSFRCDLHPVLRADYVLVNPVFQQLRLVPQGRRRALAVRPTAQGQRQLRLDASLHPPPHAPGHGRLRPRQWQHALQSVLRRRHPPRPHRGRPRDRMVALPGKLFYST